MWLWCCVSLVAFAQDALPDDPAAGHYFYAPSAIPLGRGHGTLEAREVLLLQGSFGVLDFWDVEAGAFMMAPLWGDPPGPFVGTRLAFSLSPRWHVGVGVQGIDFWGDPWVLGYANATYGDRASNFTFGVGQIRYPEVPSWTDTLALLGGKVRVSRNAALMSENLLTYGDRSRFMWMSMNGLRLFNDRFAADLGAHANLADGDFTLLPWLNLTVAFAVKGYARSEEGEEPPSVDLPAEDPALDRES